MSPRPPHHSGGRYADKILGRRITAAAALRLVGYFFMAGLAAGMAASALSAAASSFFII